MRILTVEDDELLAQTVATLLSQQHYAVDIALDGEAGWQFAITNPYDLILLDVMLPKLNGINLCRQLRQEGYQMPILLLTAKDSSTDKVRGLDAGADDYVIKPVDFDELTARIRALLRRGQPTPPLLTCAALTLDPGTLDVSYEGQPLHLTATEHQLLELFLRNPQRVFSRSAIVEHLWTYNDQPEAATVKTYIKNLRQKLKAVGASADLIETVYGLGYRLKPEPDFSESSTSSVEIDSKEQQVKEQQVLQAVTQARNSFKAQIHDRLGILQQAMKAIEAGSLGTELHTQALHESHRFAGALGTFGFTAASHLAEAIEDALQAQSPDSNQVQQLSQLVNQLAQSLERSLIQSDSIAENNPADPQLLIISRDTQWIQSLTQSACTQPITIKLTTFVAEDKWIKQTLQLIQNETPAVVLLDLDAAPIPQGMFLLTELSKRLSIPVLVTTGNDNFDHRIEVARRGGRSFLLKKTTADRILEQVIQTLQYVQTREARILVVDEDPHTLEKIQDILEPWGLQLKLLSDPQQFWQALVTFSPNLLVLGVEMSDLSGIDLCRVVRTDPNWSKLPILFLTSRSDAETIHQLFTVGADDCIPKPIAGAKLLTRILNRLARVHATGDVRH